MANNENNNLGEDVVDRRDNEDRDDVSNIGDGHHNANHTHEGVDSIPLEFQNEVTLFIVNLNTLTSGNVLYDDFELSQLLLTFINLYPPLSFYVNPCQLI